MSKSAMEEIEGGVRCVKKIFRPLAHISSRKASEYLQARAESEKSPRKETVLRRISNFLKPKDKD